MKLDASDAAAVMTGYPPLETRPGTDRRAERKPIVRPVRFVAWTGSIAIHGGLVLALVLVSGTSRSWHSLPGGGGNPRPIAGSIDPPLLVNLARPDVLAQLPLELPRSEVALLPAYEVTSDERRSELELTSDDLTLADLTPAGWEDEMVKRAVEPDDAPRAGRAASLMAKVPGRTRAAPPPQAAASAAPARDGDGSANANGGTGGGPSQVALGTAPAVDGPRCRAPTYPSTARRQGLEGTALIELETRADGTIESVTLVESSGHQILDDAALDALREWTCIPARSANGKPIAGKLRVPVRFELLD